MNGPGTPTPVATHRADRGPDDAGRVQRQVDQVQRRRPAFRRDLRREEAEDHRADRRCRRRQGPPPGAPATATDGTNGISSSTDAAASQRGDEDRAKADPVADHAAKRRHDPADQGGGPRDEPDRGCQARAAARQQLDDDRDVRAAHLGGEVRHAEDQEDPPHGRVGRARHASAPNARFTIRPVGMTSGRTSREPNPTRSAVPTDSTADDANTHGNVQPRPSTRIPARHRTDGEADRPRRAERWRSSSRAARAGRHVADTRQASRRCCPAGARSAAWTGRAATALGTAPRRRTRPPRRARSGR